MGRTSLAAIALFALSCVSAQGGEVDLPKVQAYTVAAQDTLAGLSLAYGPTDPEFAAELQSVSDALAVVRQRLDQAIESGVVSIDVTQAIDLALIATDALASATISDPDKRAKVVGTANALAGILRILRIELVE